MELLVSILDFSNAIDKDCHDLDLGDLEKKIAEMNRRAGRYLVSLNDYKKVSASDRRINVDFEAMIQLTTVLTTNCSFETLKELKREMEKRKAEILQMNLFSEYLKKNPGMDHRAGVPKGGTFVLVYADDRSTQAQITPDPQGDFGEAYRVRGKIIDQNGDALIGASILVKGTTIGTVTDFDGAFLLNLPVGAQTIVISYVGYSSQEVTITEASNVVITLSDGASLVDWDCSCRLLLTILMLF
jgi:hypothetical protein